MIVDMDVNTNDEVGMSISLDFSKVLYFYILLDLLVIVD